MKVTALKAFAQNQQERSSKRTNAWGKIKSQSIISLQAHSQDVRTSIEDLFEHVDEDASGFIEREELRKLLEDLGYKLPDDRAFEEIFRALDLSQDGKIDVFEFAAWWTEVSELVKALTEAAEARDPIALREALRPSWAVEPPLDHEDVDTAISHGHTHVLSASLSLLSSR